MKDIVLILILQLLYVPMLALRTISMVKKLSLLTAFFGFLESLVYVFGLAIVLTGEQSILAMLVYAFGFAMGLIVGIHIENRIAIGYTSVLVNIRNKNAEMIAALREKGFGVTVFEGEGKDSTRYRLDILTKRNRELELLELIDLYEPTAFVISYEPTRFKGGYLAVMMKKQSKKRLKTVPKGQPAEIPGEEAEDASWLKKTAEEIVFEVKELAHQDQTE
ncbi:DUF2179 domain-containing protein [Anaerotalea alkaliphila]|uniref:UPF0316 protein GXN74_05250 n=1 Tax=Anaerotalea alkaliphila TaxID=2662126 RepID=A0A7X5HV10_9FIRM|nr:DUF2179 domain-containing protein [Anaerotalea alkaliphila]NDL67153.1 DUF2179 domain-containing protein [Anaerotalea alkaliphila]